MVLPNFPIDKDYKIRWDKDLSHIAGNANSQTLRKFPVVTEVCVQYVKAARFGFIGCNGHRMPMQH